MLTIKRKLTYIGLAALLLLGIIYSAAYYIGTKYLNPEVIKTNVIAEAEKRLNRKVTLSDKMHFHISWNLTPYVQLFDITVSNNKKGSKSEFLAIKELELQLDLWQLFYKKFHILALKLIDSVLNLESSDSGNNWDFSLPKATSQSKPSNSNSDYELSINEIIVKRGTVSYTANGRAAPELLIQELHINSDDGRTEFMINLKGKYNSADIELDAFANILNKQQIVFNLYTLKSGNSEISGDIEIRTDPLHIKGKFTSPYLSLNDFSTHTESPNGEYSIPDIDLPTSSFTNSSVDFSLKINRLLLGKLPLENVNIQFTTANNTLQANLNPSVNLASGKVNASLDYDTKPNMPVLNLKIAATPLNLQELLNTMVGKSPISGSTLDLTINLNSSGSNLRQVVNNLNGKILAVASSGQFINSSGALTNVLTSILTGVITFKKSDANTAFSCAVVNLNVNNGIATANNGIGIEAATVDVLGSGNIDLRNGRINFKMNPKNVGNSTFDIAQFSIAQTVTVSGTISQPSVNFNPINIIASDAAKTAIAAGLLGQFAIPAELANIAYQNMNKDNAKSGVPACQIALQQ